MTIGCKLEKLEFGKITSNPFDAFRQHQDNFSYKSPLKCDINGAHLKIKPLESFKNMKFSEISEILQNK